MGRFGDRFGALVRVNVEHPLKSVEYGIVGQVIEGDVRSHLLGLAGSERKMRRNEGRLQRLPHSHGPSSGVRLVPTAHQSPILGDPRDIVFSASVTRHN